MAPSHLAAATAGFSAGALVTLLLKRFARLTWKRRCDYPRATASVRYCTSPNPGWLDSPGRPSTSPYADSDVLTLLPEDMPKTSVYAFMLSAVVPRPVAFVSTVSSEGVGNLAPYSFFGCMGHNPPLLAIAISRSATRGGNKKDTLANVEETRQLTVAIISKWFAEAANHACGEFPPEVNEWEQCGLTPEPSVKVAPARVKEAALNMECVVRSVTEFTDSDGKPTSAVVLVEVVAFHVSKGVMTTSPSGKPVIDTAKLQPVCRLGGIAYAFTNEHFNMLRPAADGTYPALK